MIIGRQVTEYKRFVSSDLRASQTNRPDSASEHPMAVPDMRVSSADCNMTLVQYIIGSSFA
jgi:hypothetical protein